MQTKTTPQNARRFVTFQVCDQTLGVTIEQVQEVLPARGVTPIPLAPPEVSGLVNLRGQIVTCIDLRRRLGLPPRPAGVRSIHVIVRNCEELVSLDVDTVGDVIDVNPACGAAPPATLDSRWRELCEDVHQLEQGLLVAIDVSKVLDLSMSTCKS